MMRDFWVFSLILVVSFGGFSSVSAKPPPAKIISGVVSNVVSLLWKCIWSLKSPTTTTTKPAVPGRWMVKFESGYNVETLFDGSKLGIEPYSVQVSPNGELLVLDYENSNIHRISMPLSGYSRPRLVSGSPEGYTGHVDGKLREARLNHPKGLTIDDQGNIYVADTMNMAIRKITDDGVTTIAGGKRGRGGGHIDGPSEDAKFSDDFDLLYVRSSCSILVVDRGNQAIREIQLRDDNCSEEDHKDFHLGIAVLIAAAFFGYMLALLQRRVQSLFSSQEDRRQPPVKRSMPIAPYERPRGPMRPPYIPPEDDEPEKCEEGFFGSLGRLVVNTGSSMAEILGGLFSGSKRKRPLAMYDYPSPNSWPPQESFVVRPDDEPPPLEAQAPRMVNKPYAFMANDHPTRPPTTRPTGLHHHHHQQQREIPHQQPRQHHPRHHLGEAKAFYEKSYEPNEIVFGAVQEQDSRRRRQAVVIKAVDYGDYVNNNSDNYINSHRNIRPRINYVGYPHAY